eukprot:TRINITY_DN3264_c0_g2_i3.p1 TRINITY_DN3264_c0_g2~~TRINITY_DN3264_c0_g2_i3.p1  ORF type:complete len:193 (+),score=47.93 TRINITY_DN3264_c0_g2_i3:133-711(+)
MEEMEMGCEKVEERVNILLTQMMKDIQSEQRMKKLIRRRRRLAEAPDSSPTLSPELSPSDLLSSNLPLSSSSPSSSSSSAPLDLSPSEPGSFFSAASPSSASTPTMPRQRNPTSNYTPKPSPPSWPLPSTDQNSRETDHSSYSSTRTRPKTASRWNLCSVFWFLVVAVMLLWLLARFRVKPPSVNKFRAGFS